MKQPKRLTRDQKSCLAAHSLDWTEWMLLEETDLYLRVINKSNKVVKDVEKSRNKK